MKHLLCVVLLIAFASLAVAAEPLRHGSPVSAVAFAPDGKWLASAGWDKTIRLWDPSTGKELRQLVGHQAEIECLAIAPDGKLIASGAWDKTIRVWDPANGKEVRQLGPNPDGILSIAFAPDGKFLASGNQDRTGRQGMLHVWDVAAGKVLRTLAGHASPVSAVAFSPDGRLLASGGLDKRVVLWEAATGRIVHELRGHEQFVFGLAFAPDGQTLASAAGDKTIRLWDVATGKEKGLWQGHQDRVRSVAFTRDGRTLLSASLDKSVRLWEVATGKERRVLGEHAAGVRSLALAPDGRFVASGSSDGTVRLRPVVELKPTQLAEGEFAKLWAALGGADAGQAFAALERLAGAAESVSLVQAKLLKAGGVDEKRVQKLIAQLDDDQFAVREQATKELQELGDRAEKALRQAVEGRTTPELRQRLETLLDQLKMPATSADWLQLTRAIEVLEYAGTEAARQALAEIAAKSTRARLAQEAKASLLRQSVPGS